MVKRCFSIHAQRVDGEIEITVILKITKELLGTSKDVMLISMYLPPYDYNFGKITQNGYGIELLEKCVMDIHNTHDDFHVLVCGDLNARTASKNYTASLFEDDEQFCRQNQSALFPRNSQDKEVNRFGEQLLEFCNIFDCIILNGLSASGFNEGSTYISDSGTSVIDYFIIF